MGLIHKPVNTKLWKKTKKKTKTNCVVSLHPESVLCTRKKAELSLLYYWSMKCEDEFKNQVGDVKPEEAGSRW